MRVALNAIMAHCGVYYVPLNFFPTGIARELQPPILSQKGTLKRSRGSEQLGKRAPDGIDVKKRQWHAARCSTTL